MNTPQHLGFSGLLLPNLHPWGDTGVWVHLCFLVVGGGAPGRSAALSGFTVGVGVRLFSAYWLGGMCVEPQAGGWGAAASLCSLFMSGLLTCDPNLQSAACKTGGVWGLLSTN